MNVTYRGLDRSKLEPGDAVALPEGSSFMIEYLEDNQTVEVSVLRTGADEWNAQRRPFGATADVHRQEDGFFKANQEGRSPQTTLHDAIYSKLSPF